MNRHVVAIVSIASSTLIVLAFIAAGLFADEPRPDIGTISPHVLHQGETALVTLTGSGLRAGGVVRVPLGANVYDPGTFTATGSDASATVTLTVAADAPVGFRNVTWVNADGSAVTYGAGLSIVAGAPPVVAPAPVPEVPSSADPRALHQFTVCEGTRPLGPTAIDLSKVDTVAPHVLSDPTGPCTDLTWNVDGFATVLGKYGDVLALVNAARGAR